MISAKDAEESLWSFEFSDLTEPDPRAWGNLPEVQVAIGAARSSAESAIAMAFTMNSLRKTAEGKAVRGKFTSEAVDCLRSALLFCGAGLDTALKRLVAEALPLLVKSDQGVSKKLSDFAETQIGDVEGAVRAKDLVRVLLGEGKNPREIMVGRWIYALESNSAQSADRVSEIVGALGVVDGDLRKRIGPTKTRSSLLEKAFSARNEIAHELDVTKPAEAARKRLENIRRYRNVDDITSLCGELLDVTQCIVNDVIRRMTNDAD